MDGAGEQDGERLNVRNERGEGRVSQRGAEECPRRDEGGRTGHLRNASGTATVNRVGKTSSGVEDGGGNCWRGGRQKSR